MRALSAKIKPANGFSYFIHLLLTALIPVLVFVLVRISFVPLAVALIILSKWRMFAVKPRYWPANVRANAVDLMVGLSIVLFIVYVNSMVGQLIWAGLYAFWLLYVKPKSNSFLISLQAIIGQTLALIALFITWGDISSIYLIFATWCICYLAARHFFTGFDEPHAPLYSYTWGYFAASLVWLLSHWLIYYGFVAQPALLLSVIGFGCGALYYLDETDRLSSLLRQQFVFIMIAIIVVVLVFSDWGDKRDLFINR